MKNSQKLKVGIIVDNVDQPFLIYDLYKKSLNSDYYSVNCLIIQSPIESHSNNFLNRLANFVKKKGIKKLIDRFFFEIIDKIETQIVKKNNKYNDFFLKHPFSKFEIKKIYVEPEVSNSGLYYSYNSEEIKKIKNLNLDVIIRGGSGILKGDILNVCKIGIFSFHHGDNDFYRGGPPGFWEVYNQEPSTGFIIQRINEVLDNGDVIFKGNIPTSFFYKLNVCKLFLKSNIFLHKILEKISKDTNSINYFPKTKGVAKVSKIPKFHQSIFYLFKTLFRGTKKIFNKLFGWSFIWNVAYQFTSDWKNPVFKRSKIIDNPKNRFLADPFVIKLDNRRIIFVEDYSFKTKKGKISAYDIKPEGHQEIGKVLEEKFHLSYPFLIKSNQNLFMVPETHEANDIRMYKCTDFPLKWKLHKILIKNIRAVDNNIIKYNNKYWLFTNRDSSDVGDFASELHIFYADELDSTSWKSHPKNPVIFDSKKARNGGKIISNDSHLYRVFQKHDFDKYGASLGISKIKILTENEYQEEIFMNLLPEFDEKILGIHNFTFDTDIIAHDFAIYEKKK